jgi:hypothetical protein
MALSFDVGIRNLAYCVVNADGTIDEWNVIDLGTGSFEERSVVLVNVLYERFGERTLDMVIIENQPVMKNPIMKSVQMIIYSFFLVAREVGMQTIGNVRLVAASGKNRLCDQILGGKGKGYRETKARAIDATRKLLVDSTWLEYFEKHKKKDDLADAFLQARACLA